MSTRSKLARQGADAALPLVADDPSARIVDSEFARALLAGLAQRPRSVSPKFFYDAAGSVLFDRICELPEYYPTRTELGILQARAGDMAACIGDDAEIVEFGAGSSRKVRLLLDALPGVRRYVPVDISTEHLHDAADVLRADYPWLEVRPLAADFTKPLQLPALPGAPARRVGFFPGSSIGNFTPEEAEAFLRDAARLLAGGGLLIGVDLVKDPAILHAAYNDAAGVTAAFNLNLLARANRELGANFDLDGFAHYAYYAPREQRIEMHLLSRRAQQVRLCGHAFDFAEGEALHTENSYKYGIDGFRALATRAGFTPAAVWCDARRWFAVHWLEAPAQ